MAWLVLLCVVAMLALAACGGDRPLPRGCLTASPHDVVVALRGAPGPVALADGTRLSTCVAGALDDADLQTVGATLTAAADRLAARLSRSGAAALQLGFLIGATERGAVRTGGVGAELATRVRRAAGLDGGPSSSRAQLLRGRAAGRARG